MRVSRSGHISFDAPAREAADQILWPSRKSCVTCGTRKGRLRKRCPYCAKPVCEDCYPFPHRWTTKPDIPAVCLTERIDAANEEHEDACQDAPHLRP